MASRRAGTKPAPATAARGARVHLGAVGPLGVWGPSDRRGSVAGPPSIEIPQSSELVFPLGIDPRGLLRAGLARLEMLMYRIHCGQIGSEQRLEIGRGTGRVRKQIPGLQRIGSQVVVQLPTKSA